jgi:hypothetical protein
MCCECVRPGGLTLTSFFFGNRLANSSAVAAWSVSAHIERALFPGLVTADGQASVMRPHEYDPPPGYVMWDQRPKTATKSGAMATPPAAAMPER